MHRSVRSGWKAVQQGAVVLTAVAAAVWISWLLSPRRGPTRSPEGASLSEVSLRTLDGAPGALVGCRAVLVFSVRCPACRIALHLFNGPWGRKGARSLVVGVSVSPAVETRRLIEEQRTGFPVLLADADEVGRRWDVSVLPTLVLLDEDRRVIDVLAGARCLTRGPAALTSIESRRIMP
jgi:peroxiredoxin